MSDPLVMPDHLSDGYADRRATGQLQRQLGEVFIDQAGVAEAKASLARALTPDPEPTP